MAHLSTRLAFPLGGDLGGGPAPGVTFFPYGPFNANGENNDYLPGPDEMIGPLWGGTAPGGVFVIGPTNDGSVSLALSVIGPTHPSVSTAIAPNQLEILSTRAGIPRWTSATGTLVALGGPTVSCSRAASGYCLGDDGLLHLLGANTVRVEPLGLLIEGASTNTLNFSQPGNTTPGGWNIASSGAALPVVTLNSTDVLDPTGANTATKCVFPASVPGGYSVVYTPNTVPANSTESVYLRTLSGTATVYVTDFAHVQVACNVTTAWQRFQVSGAVTYMEIGWDQSGGLTQPTSGGTVYAWGAQAEATPFATSLIPTSGAGFITRDVDIVTVANPLNPANPGTWRVEMTALPLDTWANVFSTGGGLNQLWTLGTAGSPNSAELRVGNSTQSVFQVQDNAGATLAVTSTVFSGSATATVVALDLAGVLSTTPAGGAPVGAGTGVITTQGALTGIGSRSGSFAFFGHMTDIVVDNRAFLPTAPPPPTGTVGPSTPQVYGPTAVIGPTKGS